MTETKTDEGLAILLKFNRVSQCYLGDGTTDRWTSLLYD